MIPGNLGIIFTGDTQYPPCESVMLYPEFSGVLVSGATKVRVGVRVEGEGQCHGGG